MTRAWIAGLVLVACGPTPPPQPPQPVHYAGPVIDVHAHLFDPEDQAQLAPGEPPGVDGLLAHDAAAHVTHSALIVMAKQGDIAATRTQNDKLLGVVKTSAGRLVAPA